MPDSLDNLHRRRMSIACVLKDAEALRDMHQRVVEALSEKLYEADAQYREEEERSRLSPVKEKRDDDDSPS